MDKTHHLGEHGMGTQIKVPHGGGGAWHATCNFRGHVTRISGKLVPTNDGAFTWYKEPPAEISFNEGEAALYTF
jgi:hypothetical protein